MRVTGKESADFAAASAFLLPRFPTWLWIQQRIMFLPFLGVDGDNIQWRNIVTVLAGNNRFTLC